MGMQCPPQPRARIVGGEAEGLGGGGVHHLEDIDAHAVGDHLHLVDQADVHRPVDVLQQLGHLGGLGRAQRHHPVDGRAVQRHAHLAAGRGVATHHLGNGAGLEVGVARVLALRRIDQEQLTADHQATLLDPRQQLLLGGAGVGGTLQRDHLPFTQVALEGIHGIDHEAHVGLAILVERGRHAEDHGIGLGDTGEVGGGLEAGVTGP